jgi:hypothetical protein
MKLAAVRAQVLPASAFTSKGQVKSEVVKAYALSGTSILTLQLRGVVTADDQGQEAR